VTRRIRSVKPEWLEDELLALASSDARVLSIGLMLLADDHGRGRASRVMLAGQVFPGHPRETLDKALEELRAIRYVVTYEVEGQSYFWIRNWAKHQKVDHPSAPKIPAPSDSSPASSGVLANLPEAVANPRASRDPDPIPSTPIRSIPIPETRARTTAPANPAEAAAIPIAERARRVLENPSSAQWSEPQAWPEVVAVAEALAKAAGHKRPRLGDCSRDAGVRIVLGHLADGWEPSELAALSEAIGRSEWWRVSGANRGLSSLTAEVLRRAQNERPRQDPRMDPEIARELERTRAMAAGIGKGGA
jgi:hypothetical protein